ncbi:C2H2 type zinc-finger-domain-containing protein [Diplogelasinospora grovesii]|uniref:C2H2 type zinc-finger-domain-containing protein n=1 Tax=Diplogelasinospora grovesii TaxID=303347 RepID=A0AAN6S426_9PEZI|nr:C2H2 type zinc-finger-domain-containing protein [Diplogelasinospora grovesii]
MATIAGNRAAPVSDHTNMDIGTSHPYTCNTCQVAFRNSDLQKGHMRSDWHRYNLKRRVASLPPISSEIFTEKVLQARATSTAEADKASFEKACETCQKTYFSENSYRNHIGSAKHRARVAAMLARPNGKVDDEASSVMSSTFSLGEPAETKSEVDSDAEEEFNEVIEGLKKTGLREPSSPVDRPSNPRLSVAARHKEEHPVSQSASERPSTSGTPSTATPTPTDKVAAAAPVSTLKSCLFCNYESPTPPLNATHMERIHGMFIPEKQYLVDLEGLLGELQKRVHKLHECLYCHKVKANAFAVQTHMRDKGHCQIPYDTEEDQLEIGEFYDFRSTYSDEESEDEDEEMENGVQNGGVKLGGKRATKVTGEDDEEVEHGDGWETDSSASSLDSEDLHAVPAERHDHQYARLDKHPHHSRADPRPHHQSDGWHAHNHKRAHAVFYDEYELHLPSGRSVGHRSLNRYFRQNLHNYPTPEERAERLAIEAAEAENAMDVDGENNRQVAVRGRDPLHGRALINREIRGLGVNGITDANKKDVQKVVLKGRKREFAGQRQKEIGVSKQYFKEYHRNHATFL